MRPRATFFLQPLQALREYEYDAPYLVLGIIEVDDTLWKRPDPEEEMRIEGACKEKPKYYYCRIEF